MAMNVNFVPYVCFVGFLGPKCAQDHGAEDD